MIVVAVMGALLVPFGVAAGASAGPAPLFAGATTDLAVAPVRQSSSHGVGTGVSSVEWVGQPSTGAPTGSALRVVQGDITITTAGTVLDGVDVRGVVFVKAPDVVIRNSVIRGRPSYPSPIALVMANHPSGRNLLIEDTEIASTVPSPYVNGINGGQFTLRRVNIHHVIDPVHVYGDNVLIENSWLHDNLHFAKDPVHGGTPSHDDSVQIQKGRNIRILDSYLSGSHNAAVQTTQDQGPIADLEIRGNYIDHGSCTLNLNDKGRGGMARVTIADNVFGMNGKYSRCAMQIPSATTVPTITNNHYIDGVVATWRRR